MLESQNIEYKSTWRDEYLKWICGFANANGGTIFIGKDNNGKTVGVADAQKLLEEIPNKVRDVLGILVDVNLNATKQGDYQTLNNVSKATATRDLAELTNKQIIFLQGSGKRDIHYTLNQK